MAARQDVNPELESFREQWRAEVRARNTASSGPQPQQGSTSSHAETSKAVAPGPPPRSTHLRSGPPKILDTDEEYVEARIFDDPEPVQAARQDEKRENEEPVTALDHYERAVEKEAAGSLGDSLTFYRKAFRVRTTLPPRIPSSH